MGYDQLLAILMVLGILCGGLWVLRRKGLVQTNFRRPATRNGEPRLEVLDRLALTPQHSVHLIRIVDRVLLVGLSPGGCNLLEAGLTGVEPSSRRER
jgi:flagellar biosynthetic protein FliO